MYYAKAKKVSHILRVMYKPLLMILTSFQTFNSDVKTNTYVVFCVALCRHAWIPGCENCLYILYNAYNMLYRCYDYSNISVAEVYVRYEYVCTTEYQTTIWVPPKGNVQTSVRCRCGCVVIPNIMQICVCSVMRNFPYFKYPFCLIFSDPTCRYDLLNTKGI